MENTRKIKAALRQLVRRAADDRPWVIFEHPTGKFVQFAGSVDEPLLLDLPWQPLSEAEFYRAATFFKRLGVTGRELEMLDPEGNKAAPQFAFNIAYPSVEAAA